MTLRPSSSSSNSSSSSMSALTASLDSLRVSRDQWEGSYSYSSSEAASGTESSAYGYSDDGDGAVVIVHEQEAAALTACCDPLKALATLRAVPGDVWVVLDAGGGTVDIAMHR
jgi:hypothetical protein